MLKSAWCPHRQKHARNSSQPVHSSACRARQVHSATRCHPGTGKPASAKSRKSDSHRATTSSNRVVNAAPPAAAWPERIQKHKLAPTDPKWSPWRTMPALLAWWSSCFSASSLPPGRFMVFPKMRSRPFWVPAPVAMGHHPMHLRQQSRSVFPFFLACSDYTDVYMCWNRYLVFCVFVRITKSFLCMSAFSCVLFCLVWLRFARYFVVFVCRLYLLCFLFW